MPAIVVAARVVGLRRAGLRVRRILFVGIVLLAVALAGEGAAAAAVGRHSGSGPGAGSGAGGARGGPDDSHAGSGGGPGGGYGSGGGPGGGYGSGGGPGGGYGSGGGPGGGYDDHDDHDDDDHDDEGTEDDDGAPVDGGVVTAGAPTGAPVGTPAVVAPEPAAVAVPVGAGTPGLPLAEATDRGALAVGSDEPVGTPPAGGPAVAPVTPPLSALDPPLAPFVPEGGLGWGIVFALVAAAVAGFAVRHATLRGAIVEARRSATRDPLTGLANRRLFDEILARELVRAQRRAGAVSLLLIDLDGFKRVNDTRGHAAGDEVLRTVAETLTDRVRGSDLPARLGGDEFAVVLPDCPATDAVRIAEHLRLQISRAVGPAVTASVGVAAVPDHAADADRLMGEADAALYRAKAGGRDRVAMASPGVARP